MGIFYSTQACSALSHGEHDQMGMRGSEASLDFIHYVCKKPDMKLAKIKKVSYCRGSRQNCPFPYKGELTHGQYTPKNGYAQVFKRT